MDLAEPKLERRFLGMIEVDSGTLLLGDPGYCLPQASEGKAGIDFQAVIDAPASIGDYLAGQPVLLLDGFGGDGSFPVYAEFDKYGEVARFTVEFVGPDDDEDEDHDEEEAILADHDK